MEILQTKNQKMKIVKNKDFIIGHITNVGNNPAHTHNDDVVDYISHPLDNNLKMFVVADGVSTGDYGAKAAKYLTDELLNWFTSLDISYINTMPTLKSIFWGKMREINKYLLDTYHKEGSTTLVCAIVGEKETMIANSGDSRGYIISDGQLKQLTADHLMWFKYNDPDSIIKDDIRFMKGNSYISRSIGSDERDFHPDVTVIDNNDYEALLLFTDGITDIVSDEKIKFIYDHNIPSSMLLTIIDEAINSNPEIISKEAEDRFKERRHMINNTTNPGKDNATMLMYQKKKVKNGTQNKTNKYL